VSGAFFIASANLSSCQQAGGALVLEMIDAVFDKQLAFFQALHL
jgi:hypothetical protein